MRTIACFIILCSCINSVLAQEQPTDQPTYETFQLYVTAPVVIDGDLSDWAEFDAPWAAIATAQHLPDFTAADPFGNRNWQGLVDFSARFKVCADDVYLYASVDVTDDRYMHRPAGKFNAGEDGDMVVLFFKQPEAGKAWHERYAGWLEIGERAGGGVTLEGRCPPYFWHSLYGWEALGAAAAIRHRAQGYTVEVKIPLAALGLETIATDNTLAFDVRVCDADGGAAGDNALCWSNDRERQNRLTDNGRLVFTPASSGAGGLAKRGFDAPVPSTIRMDADRGVVITLPEPTRRDPAVIPRVTTAPVTELQQRLAEVKNDGTADPRLILGAAGLVAGRAAFDEDWDGAVEALQDLDPLVESSPVAHRWLIKSRLIYQGKSHTPPDAATIESYEPLLGADDVNEILRVTGVEHTNQHRYEFAQQYHQRIYERATNPRVRAIALYDLGFNAKKLQRWDEAIEYFGRLAAMTEPEVPRLRKTAVGMYELGNAWMQKKDFAKAVEVWEALLERYKATDILYDHNGRVDRHPCWFLPAAQYGMGVALLPLNRTDEAVALWTGILADEQMKAQITDDQWWLYPGIYFNLGRLAHKSGNPAQAAEYFRFMKQNLYKHRDKIPTRDMLSTNRNEQ